MDELNFELTKKDDETKKCNIVYYLKTSIKKNILEGLVMDYYEENDINDSVFILIMLSPMNDTIQNTVRQLWCKHSEYVVIFDIPSLLINILEHAYVPKHEKLNTILYDNENQSIFLKENRKSIEKLSDMLPLILDLEQGPDGYPVGDDTITIPYPLLLNSYFSIVTESHFREVDKFIITEKISKALVGMHPFFLYAQPYSLSYLRENGFQTFGDIIDESYDEETDDKKRFEMITQEIIKFFKNNTLEDIHKLYYGKLYERLLHNHQRHSEFVKGELQTIEDIINE